MINFNLSLKYYILPYGTNIGGLNRNFFNYIYSILMLTRQDLLLKMLRIARAVLIKTKGR